MGSNNDGIVLYFASHDKYVNIYLTRNNNETCNLNARGHDIYIYIFFHMTIKDSEI